MVLVAKQKNARVSVAHQKRHGLHQKQTSHFMKTYWPYLPLFLFFGALVIIAGTVVMGSIGAVVGTTTVVLAGGLLLL
jgi:hypothetical protein